MALSNAALAALAVLLTVAARPQEAPSPFSNKGALGSTYDEIVVETQLAVKPKAASAASAGLGLRSARAKPVFFRPNVTSSSSSSRRATAPTAPTTPREGISYAARVVGIENPLATKARAERPRRGSESSGSYSSYSFRSGSSEGSVPATELLSAAPGSSGSYSSYSFRSGSSGGSLRPPAELPSTVPGSSGSYSSHSFRSGSSSGSLRSAADLPSIDRSGSLNGHSLLTGSFDGSFRPSALELAAAAPSGSSSSGGSYATRTWTRQESGGRTASVNEADVFQFAQGPDDGLPKTSRLHTLIVNDH